MVVPNASFAVGGTKPDSCVAVALVASLLSVPPLATDAVGVKTGDAQSATTTLKLLVTRLLPSSAVHETAVEPAGNLD